MVPCPICGDTADKPVLARAALSAADVSDLVHCRTCDVICFDPLPTAEILDRFYAKVKFGLRPRSAEAGGAWFGRRLRKIAPAGRFLDVGCGTGFFLKGLEQSTSWEVHGVEFSRVAADFARDRLGLAVKKGSLSEAGYPEAYFDYVHLNNVLEHVPDPVGLLGECRRILKPAGRIYLAVPNGLNDCRSLIDFHRSENLPAHSPSGHIYFFSARTLDQLFDRLGLTVCSRRTGSLKPGLRNSGILARKKNWKDHHFPPRDQQSVADQGVAIQPEKRWPAWYYRYRNWSAELGHLPGLHEFGLDFLFELRRGPE